MSRIQPPMGGGLYREIPEPIWMGTPLGKAQQTLWRQGVDAALDKAKAEVWGCSVCGGGVIFNEQMKWYEHQKDGVRLPIIPQDFIGAAHNRAGTIVSPADVVPWRLTAYASPE